MFIKKNSYKKIFSIIIGIIGIFYLLSFLFYGTLKANVLNTNTGFEISESKIFEGLKDFLQKDNAITSISPDPWIAVDLNKTILINKIKISIENLSIEKSNAQIYYAGEGEDFTSNKYINFQLKNGENIVEFPKKIKVKSLRFDLVDMQNISLKILNMQIIEEGHNVFWLTFVFISSLYILLVKNAFSLSMERCEQESRLNNIFKNIRYSNDQDIIKIFLVCFVTTCLIFLPYLTNVLYSIDDYYLYQIYDINLKNLWYNFYSTGRPLEGLLAEVFFYLNIQPLTRPLGSILFIAAISLFSVYIVTRFKIRSFWMSLGLMLICTTNPFFAEIMHYSIVPAYSGFAVLFLLIGFANSELYLEKKQKIYFIISLLSYISSLMIYQIFYPILLLVFLLEFLIVFLTTNNQKKLYLIKSLILYILAFIMYSILLKIGFFIQPPTLKYTGISISEILNSLTDFNYINLLILNIKTYILSNNPFNSFFLNIILWWFSLYIFIYYLLKNYFHTSYPKKIVISAILSFILFSLVGLFINLGFSILRPNEISGRTFTSFGIYQSLLVIFIYKLLDFNNTLVSRVKFLLISISVLIVISNFGRIGRVALDQYRLNMVEKSLVTRVVARLEMNQAFTYNAKLAIVGKPYIGQLNNTRFGDYNTPSLQQFSKVFAFNEITGYSFQMPNNSDMQNVNNYLEDMEPWPSLKSIKYVHNVFIVKF